MLNTYRAVFRAPGTAAFCAAAFVLRMPIAIYELAIVLIISARDGRYGFAGVLGACYVFGNAVGTPTLSRLVDRIGQRRVILPAGALHAVAVVAFALLVRTSAPQGWLVLPAVVFGFSFVSVASLVRARWSHVYGDRPELATALSLESVLDEVIFVIGPLIATVLATQVNPVLTVYVAAALVVVGSLWLAAQRRTEPPVHRTDGQLRRSALRTRGMPLLVLATTAMGMVFASFEIAAVAYCGQHGQRGISGVALAAFAVGSGTAGLFYGARHWTLPLLTRFRLQAVVFGLLPFVLLAVVNVPVLIVCNLVIGLGIAPCLITAFGLVTQLIPARTLTEGMAWTVTGLNVGYGAGSAVVGGIADAHGARTAFLVVIGAGLLVALFGLALHQQLRRRPPEREPEPAIVGAREHD